MSKVGRVVGMLVLLAIVWGGVTRPTVQAATVPGTPVTISGLDAMTATVNEQAKNGIGRILALCVAVVGLCIIATSFVGTGVIVALSGIAMAFFPGIIDTAFTATAANPLGPSALVVSWQTWYAPLMSLCYLPMLAWKVGQDPVALAAIALAHRSRLVWQHRAARVAN